MPVMFTFMLGTFPAGLVIYWAWNNVLSIMQQSFIMKRQGVEVPLLANIGLDKWFGSAAAKATTEATKAAQVAEKNAAKLAAKVSRSASEPDEAEPASGVDTEVATPTHDAGKHAAPVTAASAVPPQVQQRQQQPLNMGKSGKNPKPQPKPKNKR
jgi:YidC/Oxa1 family membrane protein insertase